MGPLKQSFVENISFQWRNCNIFGLTDTMALFAKEAVQFSVQFSFTPTLVNKLSKMNVK